MKSQTVNTTTTKTKRSQHKRTTNFLPLLQSIPDTNSEISAEISEGIHYYYKNTNGILWHGDSIDFMKSLPPESVDVVFADPPYNLKKAAWDCFESHCKYVDWSMLWIKEASRILKPEGTLYVCGFSEIVADLKLPAMQYFHSCRWIIWHYKNKANLGNDWGRSHESILHFRKSKKSRFNIDSVRIPYSEHTLKYPVHPQAESSQYGRDSQKEHVWEPHPLGAKPKDVIEIPTTCNGMHEKTPHPTQKPEELIRRILLASSNEGETILDPFVGSGTTVVCAEQLGRKWIGCDICAEYLDWGIERLKWIEHRTIQQWIDYDFENLKRRHSIR